MRAIDMSGSPPYEGPVVPLPAERPQRQGALPQGQAVHRQARRGDSTLRKIGGSKMVVATLHVLVVLSALVCLRSFHVA